MNQDYEYKSKTTIFGIPLFHICYSRFGFRGNIAKGIIAIAPISIGVISIGSFSVGLFSIGAIAIGLEAIGSDCDRLSITRSSRNRS